MSVQDKLKALMCEKEIEGSLSSVSLDFKNPTSARTAIKFLLNKLKLNDRFLLIDHTKNKSITLISDVATIKLSIKGEEKAIPSMEITFIDEESDEPKEIEIFFKDANDAKNVIKRLTSGSPSKLNRSKVVEFKPNKVAKISNKSFSLSFTTKGDNARPSVRIEV